MKCLKVSVQSDYPNPYPGFIASQQVILSKKHPFLVSISSPKKKKNGQTLWSSHEITEKFMSVQTWQDLASNLEHTVFFPTMDILLLLYSSSHLQLVFFFNMFSGNWRLWRLVGRWGPNLQPNIKEESVKISVEKVGGLIKPIHA